MVDILYICVMVNIEEGRLKGMTGWLNIEILDFRAA